MTMKLSDTSNGRCTQVLHGVAEAVTDAGYKQPATTTAESMPSGHANEPSAYTQIAPKPSNMDNEASMLKESGYEATTLFVIDDLDDDRDVLIDKIEKTPERRIYRIALEDWAARYDCSCRTTKRKVVSMVHEDMIQRGVRFFKLDYQVAGFGVYAMEETNVDKIHTRIQRCLRECVRRSNRRQKKKVRSAVSLACSQSTVSSLGSVSGIQVPPPPVQQVHVPTTCMLQKQANKVKGVDSKSSICSSTTGFSTDDQSSIHEATASEVTARTNQFQGTPEVVPLATKPEASFEDENNHATSTIVTNEMESYPSPLPEDMPHPYTEQNHSDSWDELTPFAPELQALVENDVAMAMDADEKVNQNHSLSFYENAHATTVSMMNHSPENIETLSPSTAMNETAPSSPPLVSALDAASSPIWIHLSRHLLNLEQKMDSIMAENHVLKQRLSFFEQYVQQHHHHHHQQQQQFPSSQSI